MRKKTSNFRFEKFAFFVFFVALALISAKSASAQIIMSDSSNILEIKASSTPTKSIFKFLPSTSANSFSLQAIAETANPATTISVFEYLSSNSLFKMLNGVLNFNPSNNRIGIGMTDPQQKFSVGSASSDYIQSYGGFIGNPSANIGGTGDAAYFPEGIYSAKMNWLYGGVAMNNGSLSNVGSANFSGNVGIGTTSPSYKLDVAYNGTGVNFNGNYLHNVSAPSTTTDAINKGYLDSSLETYGSKWILSGSNLYASSTAWNVGIGTNAPGAFRLFVNGAIYSTGLNIGGDLTITGGDVSISNNNGGINFNDASAYWLKTATNYGIYWDTTANQFKFNGAGVTKASIDLDDGAAYFNGSVGIGTVSPVVGSKLQIIGEQGSQSGNSFSGVLDLYNTTTGVSGENIGPYISFSGKRGAAANVRVPYGAIGAVNTENSDTSGGALVFLTKPGVGAAQNLTEQMRITVGGKVGIGTTAPNRRLDLGGGTNGRIYGIDTATNAVFTDSEVVPKKWIVDNFAPAVGGASLWATSTGGIYNVGFGNVGIGSVASTNADEKLVVYGNIVMRNPPTNQIQFNNPNVKIFRELNSMRIDSYEGWKFYDTQGSAEVMNLSRLGNLSLLGIRISTAGSIYYENDNNYLLDFSGTLANSLFVPKNIITTTGSVGVGTTAPAAGLEVLTGSNYSILAGGKRVGNVAAPVSGTDAVNRSYVDTNFIASTSLATITKAFVQGGNSFGEKAILGTNDNQALGIKTNGTEKMTILANGNVGIGTTAPGAKLDVLQNMSSYSSAFTSPHLKLRAGSAVNDTGFVGITYDASTSVNYGWSSGSLRGASGALSNFIWKYHNNSAAGVEYMRINSSGNVGIGTVNPEKKLHVGGDIQANKLLVTGSSSGENSGVIIRGDRANLLFDTVGVAGGVAFNLITAQVTNTDPLTSKWGTVGLYGSANVGGDPSVYYMYFDSRPDGTYSKATLKIDPDNKVGVGLASTIRPNNTLSVNGSVDISGNVGIGKTNPTHKLHVAGDASFSDNQIHGVSAPATGTDAANRFYVDGLIADLSSQITHSYWSASGNNIFNNNKGNVGIGTSTPVQKLDVVGSVNVSTGYRINNIATNGKYLRGNGTNFVESSIQAGDVPTLNQNTAGYAGNLVYEDNRAISPSELVASRMKFGFTSYANNSSSPYADFLHFNSYGDVSGGNANLLVINKSAIGMRLYQQVFGTTTNFSAYKDVVLANNTPALNYLTKYASTGNSVTVSSSQVYDNGTRVGVGTTAPSHKLHVVGEGNFNSSQVHGVSSPTVDTDVANQGYVKSSVEGSAFWKFSGSNVYTSSTAWNVGIGVNNPGAYKLFVAGNSYLSGKVNIGKSDSYGELEILHNNNISDPDTSFYPLRIKNDSWSGNQITGIEFWNGSHKTVPTARIISQMAGSGGDGENLHFQTQTKSATNPNPNEPTTKMTITNTGEVGIGTTAPSSKLHVVGSSYLNGTIKTALTGTGSRCLHVDSNGVIGTMAGDCGTSTGGDNLGNHTATENIKLGNYWLSGDGGNEGVFVKSDGNVGVGTNYPDAKLNLNGSASSTILLIDSSNPNHRAQLKIGTGFGNTPFFIDSLFRYIDQSTFGGSSLSLNPSGGSITAGGTIYNTSGSYWLRFDSTLTDSLKVQGDLNTTGILKSSGTGANYMMGRLGVGTTNPGTNKLYVNGAATINGTLNVEDSLRVSGNLVTTAGKVSIGTTYPATAAGMTIDTPVASSSILFRAAGAYKASLSFENGFFLGKDDTPSFSYSGVSNIGIGHGALERGSGDGNIAIGGLAAYYNNAANNNIAIGTGAAQEVNTSGNIALGWQAFNSSGATGGNNIAIGVAALANGAVQKNIAIGYGALNTANVGSYNIAIGNRGAVGSNKKLYIGDLTIGVSPYTPLIYGDMTSTASFGVGIGTTTLGTTTAGTVALTVAGNMFATGAAYADGFYGPNAMGSDIRLKHDIKTLSEEDYRKVFKLRPVSFTYNKNNRDDYGFIAQEVQKLYPETVTNGGDGNLYIYYNSLIAPTVAAVQAQEKKIEEQETLINILLDRVNKLENSAK